MSFVARANEINKRDELFVHEVTVFGSYLTDSGDLGDIDLVIEFQPRREKHTEGSHYRADNSGKTLDFTGSLDYGSNEGHTVAAVAQSTPVIRFRASDIECAVNMQLELRRRITQGGQGGNHSEFSCLEIKAGSRVNAAEWKFDERLSEIGGDDESVPPLPSVATPMFRLDSVSAAHHEPMARD